MKQLVPIAIAVRVQEVLDKIYPEVVEWSDIDWALVALNTGCDLQDRDEEEAVLTSRGQILGARFEPNGPGKIRATATNNRTFRWNSGRGNA